MADDEINEGEPWSFASPDADVVIEQAFPHIEVFMRSPSKPTERSSLLPTETRTAELNSLKGLPGLDYSAGAPRSLTQSTDELDSNWSIGGLTGRWRNRPRVTLAICHCSAT